MRKFFYFCDPKISLSTGIPQDIPVLNSGEDYRFTSKSLFVKQSGDDLKITARVLLISEETLLLECLILKRKGGRGRKPFSLLT
jgi:hypothetical protein